MHIRDLPPRPPLRAFLFFSIQRAFSNTQNWNSGEEGRGSGRGSKQAIFGRNPSEGLAHKEHLDARRQHVKKEKKRGSSRGEERNPLVGAEGTYLHVHPSLPVSVFTGLLLLSYICFFLLNILLQSLFVSNHCGSKSPFLIPLFKSLVVLCHSPMCIFNSYFENT